MFTFWSGTSSHLCGGRTRRDFLKLGALGVGGLTLPDMLRARAQGKPKRAKSVIMICLFGGPPHTDTYDLKPDAPDQFRGEFKPIKTNVPGVEICELFPLQAKMWDKLAVVRSVVAGQEDHRDQETHTGFVNGRPSFGSVISKIRGPAANGMPPYVNLRFESTGLEPAYLGLAHKPFSPRGPAIQNLVLSPNMAAGRVVERRQLLAAFDDMRREVDASGSMAGLDAFQTRAFDMILSGEVAKALDFSTETVSTRERYKGVEKFLLARRLVEAGVGAITLDIGNWDTHFDNFKYLKEWLPKVDRAVTNLIQDLHDRGLGDDVVTIMWGEFGRTPKINERGGRDHWAPAMSTLIAGGGLKMGQAIGSTTSRGEMPKSRPYKVPQVLSTVYRAVGIDPAQTFPDGNGRPMYILDHRDPVTELL
jgi:hypothetical protein